MADWVHNSQKQPCDICGKEYHVAWESIGYNQYSLGYGSSHDGSIIHSTVGGCCDDCFDKVGVFVSNYINDDSLPVLSPHITPEVVGDVFERLMAARRTTMEKFLGDFVSPVDPSVLPVKREMSTYVYANGGPSLVKYLEFYVNMSVVVDTSTPERKKLLRDRVVGYTMDYVKYFSGLFSRVDECLQGVCYECD